MWIFLRKRTLCFAFCAASLLWPSWAGATGPAAEEEQTVVMPAAQYRTLKETAQKLKAELILQETRIEKLESSSTTSTEELNELRNELTECRTRLANAKSSLEKSDEEMKNAKASLETLNEHLQILNSKIKSLEHKRAVVERQRNLWIGVAVCSLGVLVISDL